MEEVSSSECVPDLKELEVKVGRKTPEGLLRWMRQDAAQRGEHSKVIRQESVDSGEHGLDEKIRKLKVEMLFSGTSDSQSYSVWPCPPTYWILK